MVTFLQQNNLIIIASAAILILILILLLKSSRKKTQDYLQEKDQALQTLKLLTDQRIELDAVLQTIEDGVIITNLEGQIVLASNKALALLNTNLYSVQNKDISEILPINIHRLDNQINSDTSATVQLQNGAKITTRIKGQILMNDAERKGLIFILHDITEEEDLDEMKFDFITMATHQLRTPLTILKGYLSILSKSIAGKNSEDKQTLEKAIVGADKITSLVENILSATKISGSHLLLQLKQISIKEIIENVISELTVVASKKNVTLLFETLETPLPTIKVDPYLIAEVLNNLIMNAIEHSHNDGQVTIQVRPESKEILVDIRDEGEGIPLEVLPYLFNKKFYKIPNYKNPEVMTQTSQGLGLGLYLSKLIIEAHHGKIWVNSILGKGATFSFSLPIN